MSLLIVLSTFAASNAQNENNVPELLKAIIKRCTTDASCIETCVLSPTGPANAVTTSKIYYKNIDTYRIESESGGEHRYINIQNNAKRYIYTIHTMKLEAFNGSMLNHLQLIGKSKVDTFRHPDSDQIIYEFMDESGRKVFYIVDKKEKTLITTIFYDEKNKERLRKNYSHWKFEKQPAELFDPNLLQIKKSLKIKMEIRNM